LVSMVSGADSMGHVPPHFYKGWARGWHREYKTANKKLTKLY